MMREGEEEVKVMIIIKRRKAGGRWGRDERGKPCGGTRKGEARREMRHGVRDREYEAGGSRGRELDGELSGEERQGEDEVEKREGNGVGYKERRGKERDEAWSKRQGVRGRGE
jgi:hypothetical protein